MQNLKAVTMGVVTAIALFWSNKPNPAMHSTSASSKLRELAGCRA
jgi:hypothetical protein